MVIYSTMHLGWHGYHMPNYLEYRFSGFTTLNHYQLRLPIPIWHRKCKSGKISNSTLFQFPDQLKRRVLAKYSTKIFKVLMKQLFIKERKFRTTTISGPSRCTLNLDPIVQFWHAISKSSAFIFLI